MARDRAFKVALLVSIVFHLSMVTVFRVVIYFPRNDIKFYTFELVEQPRAQIANTGFGGELRVPSAEEALAQLDARSGGRESEWRRLPEIQLPTVEFAGLRRLSALQRGLEVSGRIMERYEEPPADSWARFGRGLESLTDALARRLTGQTGEPRPEPILVDRPASGLASYIEWMEAPYDRQLLFAPPIEAFRGADAPVLGATITLVFTVDAEGRIIEVLTPLADSSGIVDSVSQTLLDYRFAPLPASERSDQRGTFVITTEPAQ